MQARKIVLFMIIVIMFITIIIGYEFANITIKQFINATEFEVENTTQNLNEAETTEATETTSATEATETTSATEATETTNATEFNEQIFEQTESKKEEIVQITGDSEGDSENETKNENTDNNFVSLGEFKLTAYCSCSKCCGKWAGGATASGVMPVANHTIAVDTSIIPFGTEVVINGVVYVAEDTGSAINGNRIDIYFDSHQEALNFGVQYAEVFKIVN